MNSLVENELSKCTSLFTQDVTIKTCYIHHCRKMLHGRIVLVFNLDSWHS